MLKNWRIVATVLAAFVIGQLDPVGFVYWRVAEWRLPQIRTESLAHVTPFESIPRSQWVGETANTFAFNDINHNAPVHILIVPKKRINTVLVLLC